MTKSPLRVLFFLRSIHYDRVLENFLRAVLERGHEMHVALALEKRGLGEEKTKIFDELRERYSFSYERLPARRDLWLAPAVALRHATDYLRYLEPEFASAGPLRDRARSRAPRWVRMLVSVPPFRGQRGRRLIAALIRRLEAAVPVPKEIIALVQERKPDVVLVSPLVGLGSIESDYVRAAAALGVPTVLPVASWDNLTNKGILRDTPTLTIVWNHTQVDEAVKLHGIPPDQVVAVGAHSFDHWFTWRPSTTREEFTQRLDLDAGRPIVLYLGSSFFIAGNETSFVREWLRHVREHPRLREAAVILRPHPQNVVGWKKLDVDEPGKTVVWPRGGEAPTSERQKRDYFDTLFHSAAMVGINTSALIEAAILHKPLLTLVNDSFATQEGTLHFAYLAREEGDGPVTVGRSWDEHLDQLADAIDAPEAYEERIEAFLGDFVRPNGIDVPAAPAAAAAVERAAATAVEPRRSPRLLRALLLALSGLVWLVVPLLHPRDTYRAAVKSARKRLKAIRRKRRQLRNRVVSWRANRRRPAPEPSSWKARKRAKRSEAEAREPALVGGPETPADADEED